MPSDGDSISETFCAAPWVHFATIPDGSVSLCCSAKDAVRREDGHGYNLRQNRLDEIWNGAGFKHLRHLLLKGEKLPHCVRCYERESHGFNSYRQLFNEKYLRKNGKSDREAFLDQLPDREDLLTARKPIFLDVRMGNICNLKCRMCGPGLSSQIEKDGVATAWIGHNPQTKIGEDVSAWPEAPDLMAQLKDFCVDAKRIEFIGGEPTLNRGQMELLQSFVERDLAMNIEILMITNMTNAQDKIFSLVSKFKNPNIHISVEAIGQVNDYIRFPAKWRSLSEQFKKVRQKYSNIAFGVSPTFQAYNILYVCDLFDWCLENNVEFTTGNTLSYPSWLSVTVLPQPVRIVAAEKLEQWAATRNISAQLKDEILSVAHYLRDENHTASEADIDNFVRYTNDLDRSRKQDITQSLPELYDLWVRYRPWDHQAFRHTAASDTPAANDKGANDKGALAKAEAAPRIRDLSMFDHDMVSMSLFDLAAAPKPAFAPEFQPEFQTEFKPEPEPTTRGHRLIDTTVELPVTYVALPEAVQPAADTLTHTFHLRPDFQITVALPANMTDREAERLARFVQSLPMG